MFGKTTVREVSDLADEIVERLSPVLEEMVDQRVREALAERLRPLEARLDRADPGGRLPDVTDDLAAEEDVAARLDWELRGGGRAASLIGRGLNGEQLARQMILEAQHVPGMLYTDWPGHEEETQPARDLTARLQAERTGAAPFTAFGPAAG